MSRFFQNLLKKNGGGSLLFFPILIQSSNMIKCDQTMITEG
ncbi:hypothetical protein B4110_1340 [Parageobacillus toebii]|uniref:Uncharacterized protein n=1 Tax=Parageobacillus toebii TaxID=153151 RepID=A0A150MZB7_9BACL|nr:hypothetical protein B4110_1340 [Parageobacillus toebii]